MNNIPKVLYQQKLITENQYAFFESIRKEETISVYYELRLLLYSGILLLTSGLGYLVYENIGSAGHILAMVLLGLAIFIGFNFISKFSKPYSHEQVTVKLVYFDYLLILVSLLIIGLFTYVQVYFDLVAILASWSSFISASILIFMAYRYDNRGLLSMGITALAAALGLSITTVDWTINEWTSPEYTYLITTFFGGALYWAGFLSEKKDIKKHFQFTYQNFGLILYYLGCISGIFLTDFEIAYVLLALISSLLMSLYTWKTKEFLFFLYSNIAAFIAITYIFFTWAIAIDGAFFMVYYFPFTCIGYALFLMNKKSHFAHD